MTKWGDRPHWTYEALWLGCDEHGDWVGVPRGTRFTRPGHTFVGPNEQVVLVPRPADGDPTAWSLATFHGPGAGSLPPLGGVPVALYVDVTTPATWDGGTLRAVDLDLDVLAGDDGRVLVDDEDEFDEHRVALGYPDEVVEAARAGCAAVLAAVRGGHPPYDGAHRRWLDALAALTASGAP
ncbi:DUF402 domain-containing protein [Nocardioides solisilvae]|uniref:DUF402 domain-containing protein n=1 Tax=Nocardioides solisilvae TaxID=1542435 RepID=UPI0013A5677A|nr:DUF402 domain-containing protein [Nocardioides solisilvae]